jgi:hypothetical protein
VSVQGLLFFVALGAAAIAVWLTVRFPSREPRNVRWSFMHMGISIFAVMLMPKLIALVVNGSDLYVRKMAAVFVVVLPLLTYAWLATIWILKTVQRAAHLR